MSGRQLPAGARRAIGNDPRLRGMVMGELAAVFDPSVPFSGRPNAQYGAAEFHSIMMGAAALGTSVYGYAAAARRWKTASRGLARGHRRAPSGEWMCDICLRIDPEALTRQFEEKVASHVERLRSLGQLRGKTVDIAIDMHLICHRHKDHGADLVRSKSKRKVDLFARYVTAQCVAPGAQLALGGLHVPALEETADYVRRAVSACRRAGAEVGAVMLDRGFFSTEVIRALGELGVGYLMPCVNTANVIAAIREFDRGERAAVSRFRIAKSENDCEEYDMIIAGRKKQRRKKKGGDRSPEERYTAFATNRPGISADRYAERWMIETGYRMVENERVRTRSRNAAFRTFCFLYSLVLFNAWVIANAELSCSLGMAGGAYRRITQTDMKVILLTGLLSADPEGGRGLPAPAAHAAAALPAAAPEAHSHYHSRHPTRQSAPQMPHGHRAPSPEGLLRQIPERASPARRPQATHPVASCDSHSRTSARGLHMEAWSVSATIPDIHAVHF